MLNLLKTLFGKSRSPVQPIEPVERYQCPFYGYHAEWGMMMDQKGNQCALKVDSYAPCHREMEGKIPNIHHCEYSEFYEDVKKKGVDVRVFPSEFNPKKKTWKGIPFERWDNYVMNEAPRLNEKPRSPPLDVIIIRPEDLN